MTETSVSLLDRLRDAPSDADWRKLVDLYRPLMHGWLARHARLQAEDLDDVVQDVLAIVVRKLPEFQRERTGAFRAWLRTVTVNALRRHWRSGRARPTVTGNTQFLAWLEQLADAGSTASRVFEREHDEHVLRRLLAATRADFREKTWQAFERVSLQGESVEDVARMLDMTPNAVLVAKSRVLKRLRQEASGLVDEDEAERSEK